MRTPSTRKFSTPTSGATFPAAWAAATCRASGRKARQSVLGGEAAAVEAVVQKIKEGHRHAGDPLAAACAFGSALVGSLAFAGGARAGSCPSGTFLLPFQESPLSRLLFWERDLLHGVLQRDVLPRQVLLYGYCGSGGVLLTAASVIDALQRLAGASW
jgi:hypothetical protein